MHIPSLAHVLKKRIKRVPIYLQDFQHFEKEFWRSTSELHAKVGKALYHAERNSEEISLIRERMEELTARTDLYAWELMRKGDETRLDTAQRFFSHMPPATGSLRLLQLGMVALLREFDELCAKNDLNYWAIFGTLLGAFRHQGFIPWDDDIDLYMPRSDIKRLIDIVKSNPRYKVSVVWDQYAFSRQVRFMYSDPDLPCFLDLFIADYGGENLSDFIVKQRDMRARLQHRIKQDPQFDFWSGDNAYLNAEDPRSAIINEAFMHVREQEIEQGMISEKETSTLVWAPDTLNCSSSFSWVCHVEKLFPVQRISFEHVECNAPADIEGMLSETFGDIWNLPSDITSHFAHVGKEKLREESTVRALNKLTSHKQ